MRASNWLPSPGRLRARSWLAVAVALMLAGCNWGDASSDEPYLSPRVRAQASATPSTVSANEQIVLGLTVTANSTITADVTLRVLKPDGTVGHTATWPSQVLARRVPKQLEDVMIV